MSKSIIEYAKDDTHDREISFGDCLYDEYNDHLYIVVGDAEERGVDKFHGKRYSCLVIRGSVRPAPGESILSYFRCLQNISISDRHIPVVVKSIKIEKRSI